MSGLRAKAREQGAEPQPGSQEGECYGTWTALGTRTRMRTGSVAVAGRLSEVPDPDPDLLTSAARQVFAEVGLAPGAMSGGKQAWAPERHPGALLWAQGGTEGAGCRIHSLLPAAREGAASQQERTRGKGRAAAPEREGRWERVGAQDCMWGAARAAGLSKGPQAYAVASPWCDQEQVHLQRRRLLSQRKT